MKQTILTSPRLCGYVRGSTEEQKNTLEAQPQDMKNYAQFKRLEIPRIFIDSGTSAYTVPFLDRPVVQEMFAYMQAEGITQIVVTKLDRAFRSAKDCLNTVDALQEAGYDFHILNLNIDTREPQGKFFLTVMAGLGELENGIRSQRQRDGFAVMRKNRFRAGAVPFGWDAIESTRISKTTRQADNLVPNPKEQQALRWILEQSQEGYGTQTIANALNDNGIPSKKGGKWYASTVQSVRDHALLDEPAASMAA